MTTIRKIAVRREREVKTYAELWHTSYCLLKKGLENPEGSTHQFRASLVFTAFTLEAALNHIGDKIFRCWNDLERLGPREKINLLGEKLAVDIDYGNRPWQIIKELFGFRNKVGHGKTKKININPVVPFDQYSFDEEYFAVLKSDWEKYCTKDNAEKARNDVDDIIRILYKAGNFKDDYPFDFGHSSGGASVIYH